MLQELINFGISYDVSHSIDSFDFSPGFVYSDH